MRRRALLAASVAILEDEKLPPESTTFEFPLYLNTKVVERTPDQLYRSREADDISNQLSQFYADNYSGEDSGGTGDIVNDWPKNFFNNYPVFIDGYQVEYVGVATSMGAEYIETGKDYGGYNEIYIGIDFGELYVEGFN